MWKQYQFTTFTQRRPCQTLWQLTHFNRDIVAAVTDVIGDTGTLRGVTETPYETTCLRTRPNGVTIKSSNLTGALTSLVLRSIEYMRTDVSDAKTYNKELCLFLIISVFHFKYISK